MIRRQARRVLRAYADERRLATLAAQSGLSPQEAARRVGAHLDRLVASRHGWAQRSLALLTRPVVARTQLVDVDVDALRRLRELGPLVFLPAHRSYADSLVLAAALREAGMPQPWRLAGENLSFWPLGALARRSATVFIRRDFGRDPTYHLAVRCYLADLLARGQSVEWYPEAGRSRTGRLRKLRHGMLRILAGAYLDSGIDDVHVVPVSIVYDLSPEIEAVTAQDGGAAKPAEGLRALIRYRRACRALGPRTARPTFAEPISLRELTHTSANEWGTARALAREVARRLREATPATAESLLTLALASGGPEPRSAADLAEAVGQLLDYASERQIPTCGRLPTELETVLDRMVRAGVLTRGLDGYALAPDRRHVAAYYRNTAEHWFMPRAVAELIAFAAVNPRRALGLLAPLGAMPASEAAERLLERELAALADPDRPEREPFLLAPRLLGPVFEAYHHVAVRLTRSPRPPDGADRAHLAAVPADDGPPAFWPESRSAELRDAGIAALTAEGLLALDADADADDTARTAYAREISHLVTRLRELAAIDARRQRRHQRHAGSAHVRG